jgi:triosephosphate isomerase
MSSAAENGETPGRNPSRRPFVAGNWKMHLLRWEADALATAIRAGMAANPAEIDVALFPSFPLLPTVVEATAASGLGVGGQDLHPEEQGAFTGDVSGRQLRDAGASWVLCGHSERRQFHREDDGLVARKAAAAVRAGLLPVVCVGESRAERQAGRTFEVLDRQLAPLLETSLPGLVLAYEPVWAIGTGEVATPELAQEAHAHLRGRFRERRGAAAEALRILYGGSVNPGNATGLAAMPDLDGALVGGASLGSGKFLAIISSFAAAFRARAARGIP